MAMNTDVSRMNTSAPTVLTTVSPMELPLQRGDDPRRLRDELVHLVDEGRRYQGNDPRQHGETKQQREGSAQGTGDAATLEPARRGGERDRDDHRDQDGQ
jgi:hypothetical protein